MVPEISVVIPTHNRAEQLARTLSALGRQSLDPRAYEIVLVADGCSDATAAVVQRLPLPCPLIFVEQPGRGAAAARNRGVSAASARLLLFLDDDKEAAPDLLQVHLEAHSRRPGGVVLGYYPMPADFVAGDPFAMAAKHWWDARFAERTRPEHRFTFQDFCSGNVSLATGLFRSLGGFDESFPNADGEDYEFGIRLLKRDIPFQFVRNALSLHYERLDLERTLRRARGRGFAHARMAQKHIELFWSFNVHNLSRLQAGLFSPLWRLVWRWPRSTDVVAYTARILLHICRALRITSLMWRLSHVAAAQAYWRGVHDALRRLDVWEQLFQDAPLAPASREIAIDLASDLRRLDEIFKERAADSVLISCRSVPLGRLWPVAGAERLSGTHVREYIEQRFAGALLALLVDDYVRRPADPKKQELLRYSAVPQ